MKYFSSLITCCKVLNYVFISLNISTNNCIPSFLTSLSKLKKSKMKFQCNSTFFMKAVLILFDQTFHKYRKSSSNFLLAVYKTYTYIYICTMYVVCHISFLEYCGILCSKMDTIMWYELKFVELPYFNFL